jgi:hypothetical protein
VAPHLSNVQFFIALGILAFVSLLTLAAIVDIRKKRKTPLFFNCFYADLDQAPYERIGIRQSSASSLQQWRAHNRAEALAFEDRHTALRNTR